MALGGKQKDDARGVVRKILFAQLIDHPAILVPMDNVYRIAKDTTFSRVKEGC